MKCAFELFTRIVTLIATSKTAHHSVAVSWRTCCFLWRTARPRMHALATACTWTRG